MKERFIDVFKRAIKASGIETVNQELQKFFSIYRITPNVDGRSGMAPAELTRMFATWEEGTIDNRIGKMLLLIKHLKQKIKRHLNQIRKKIYSGRRSTQGGTDDMFDVTLLQPVQQNLSSKRKRIPKSTTEIDPK